ncbi:MAG: DUF401 family protein, partial [Firmicutes bacterium]|nr:DUF401 family protein [Bacillota bacterium]
MWPLVKVFAVFVLIIVMLRQKVGLGITMLVAAGVLGLLFGLGMVPLLQQMAVTLIDPATVVLITALVLIMILESVMRKTGMLQAMTDSMFHLPWNPRILVAAIPAIIGFLPSAGGARFSAPLVAQATAGKPYRPEDKVFINYWFRHVWEYSLPLYPGLILAAHFSGIPLGTILLWQWPVSVIWAILGYWFVFRNYKRPGLDNGKELKPDHKDTRQSLRALAANTWPIWTTVAMVLGSVPIVWSLSIVLFILIVIKRHPLRFVRQTLREPLTRRIVFLTWGTMAFKDVLQASGAVYQVSNAVAALGIPAVFIVILLPLVVGMLTGLVQACIGA